MGLRRTKMDENNATSFHSLACGAAKPTVFFPIRVSLISGYFRRSPHEFLPLPPRTYPSPPGK